MVSFPNAKINIGLNILSKREDGYHNISSVFYPLPFEDVLEILPSDHYSFEVTGVEVPGKTDDNLIAKAYQLLKQDHDLPPVQIHLHKIIPIGAGLGGGSSDAAFAIKNINTAFALALPEEQMAAYAAQLGSDCPFFIENKPVLVGGTGDRFSGIKINLKGKYLVLICPDIQVSTAKAYAAITPGVPEKDIKDIIENAPLSEWKKYINNDFEKPIFQLYPEINGVKRQLYKHGAVYASMSGSGSSVYGIFEKKPATLPFTNIGWQGFLP